MMISALLAAAIATSPPAPAPAPTPPKPTAAAADPQVTAQTPLTVTFSAGFLETVKAALHSKYTGDEADPAIKIITDQENAAIAQLESTNRTPVKP